MHNKPESDTTVDGVPPFATETATFLKKQLRTINANVDDGLGVTGSYRYATKVAYASVMTEP